MRVLVRVKQAGDVPQSSVQEEALVFLWQGLSVYVVQASLVLTLL